jgi:hypothetical protein
MHIHRRDRDLVDAALAVLNSPPPPEENRDELPPTAGVRALFGDEADTKELE